MPLAIHLGPALAALTALSATSGTMAFADGVTIATPEQAETYVLDVLAEAECRMRYSDFLMRLERDGLSATEEGAESDEAVALVAAAPLALLQAGLIAEDPGDPQILVSSGPGCV